MARAEIISIGTELLLGDVLDTNSQFFSKELALLGIDCVYRATVGDNKDRIIACLKSALERADVVITSGGLGPTADDLTHECMAELFAVEMEFDPETLKKIERFFRARGAVMVDSNRKQAYRPKGADILVNPSGTAPGIIWKLGADDLQKLNLTDCSRPRVILTFPGVPSEMKNMWSATAKPFLTERFEASALWSCELKHYGIGESALAEKFAELLNGINPTVAPYAGTGECRLRVTAKGVNLDEAKNIAAPVIDKIRAESGALCYGVDDDSLESVLAQALKACGATLSVAESCTGGLVSKRLTDVAGSSAFIKLNVVSYANEAKQKILSVPEEVLTEYGAVSAECAAAMATGIRALAQSDYALSITGIAGPDGGTDEKPVGLVYFGLSTESETRVFRRRFPSELGRQGIRYRCSSEALNFLRLYLINPELVPSDL